MADAPDVADVDKWKKHMNMSQRDAKQRDFYAVKPKLFGKGDDAVVMVSPTEQSVERAKADMQYKRKLEDSVDHSPSRSRASNISNKRQKKNGV